MEIPLISSGVGIHDKYYEIIRYGFNECLNGLDDENNQASYKDYHGNIFTVSRLRPNDGSNFIYSFRVGERTLLTGVTDPSTVDLTEYRNLFRFIKIKGY